MDLSKALKRFYKTVNIEEREDGYSVLLDKRDLKSPAKRPFILPSKPLAEAIATEWDAQKEHIDSMTMPHMALAATAIDRISQQRPGVIEQMSKYGETDLICYWSDEPKDLHERQKTTWQPYLDWAQEDLGLKLNVHTDIMQCDQPEECLKKVHKLIDAYDNWSLSALSSATHCTGSIIISLALVKGRISLEDAFNASQVDETYQIELWGEDWEAKERREAIKRDLNAVISYLSKL